MRVSVYASDPVCVSACVCVSVCVCEYEQVVSLCTETVLKLVFIVDWGSYFFPLDGWGTFLQNCEVCNPPPHLAK